jgi:hypothetical protein
VSEITASAPARTQLAATIDTIERAYEYLLAYAAQGRRDDTGTEARATLATLHGALGDIGAQARAALADQDQAAGGVDAYLDAVDNDARVARGAVALVLGQPRIGSLLVDNLNASVHLRALLTDAFLLDQALQSLRD